MDIRQIDIEDLVCCAATVVISYTEYLLDKRDHLSLAKDMKALLDVLPKEIQDEIQRADYMDR